MTEQHQVQGLWGGGVSSQDKWRLFSRCPRTFLPTPLLCSFVPKQRPHCKDVFSVLLGEEREAPQEIREQVGILKMLMPPTVARSSNGVSPKFSRRGNNPATLPWGSNHIPPDQRRHIHLVRPHFSVVLSLPRQDLFPLRMDSQAS